MKILIISMCFFLFLRVTSWFGDGLKKSIEGKKLHAMDVLEQQIAKREMMYQELQRGEQLPMKIRRAIQLEEWDKLSEMVDQGYADLSEEA